MIERRILERVMRLATWVCVVVLAILSLLPKEDMIRTGADGRFEHFIAYAGTMAVAAIGYGPRFGRWSIVLALIAYAGALELGQYFAHGRTPAVADFAAGAVGVLVASLGFAVLVRQ